MAYYLVDYENVKVDGMSGVDQLGKKDHVCIFYSENASTLTFGLHESLNQSKAKILLQKVEVGVKNALDFQLSTYLGYLISENEGKGENYYIVSEDKGLAILTGYWAERGESVKTAADIATAKEDQEEEKEKKEEQREEKREKKEEKKEDKKERKGKERAEKRENKEDSGDSAKREEKGESTKEQEKKHPRKNSTQRRMSRLQVHTKRQDTVYGDYKEKSEQENSKEISENTKVSQSKPIDSNKAEKAYTTEAEHSADVETGSQKDQGEITGQETKVRKPVHRKYKRYRNYRKYPQKNRQSQESAKVIHPILSAGK